jgi:hypothetical protein
MDQLFQVTYNNSNGKEKIKVIGLDGYISNPVKKQKPRLFRLKGNVVDKTWNLDELISIATQVPYLI